jgi:hypothetical protein
VQHRTAFFKQEIRKLWEDSQSSGFMFGKDHFLLCTVGMIRRPLRTETNFLGFFHIKLS